MGNRKLEEKTWSLQSDFVKQGLASEILPKGEENFVILKFHRRPHIEIQSLKGQVNNIVSIDVELSK